MGSVGLWRSNQAAQPLVSVIVPTFNRLDYLRVALQSAAAQSWQNTEIIVQDNASVRDPYQIVAGFHDPRMTYFRNPRHVSQTANIMSACLRAHGKYVAVLNDDDLWEPEFLAMLVGPLEADESVVLSFCDHDIIDAAGKRNPGLADKVARRFQRHVCHAGRHQPFDTIALVSRSICALSAAVFRRADIDWNDVPKTLVFGADLYLAYLAARTGMACHYVPQRLAQIRYHSGSVSSSLNGLERRLANARNAMIYWDCLRRDQRLLRHRRFFEMKLCLDALAVITMLIAGGDWREGLRQLKHSVAEGLLRPQNFIYYPFYAARLHRLRA
jgi:glycosyltransferase involved in cell wall biosynthesis